MLDRSTLAQLPLFILMVYFGSGLELYLNTVTGIPPLYGQLAGLGFIIAWIGSIAVMTNGQNLVMPRVVTVIYGVLLLFCFINAVSFTYSSQADLVVDALVARVKAIVFIVVFSIVLVDPGVRAKAAYAAGVIAILGAMLSLFDFVTPTFSTVPGRGASFYLNSNETAMLLVAFGVIASTQLRLTTNYAMWIVIAMGVLVTFSRSGWLMLMIALFGLSMIGKFGGGRGRFVLLGGVGLVIASVFAAYVSGDLYTWLSRSTFAEYLDPNTLARLGSRGAAIDDYSALERQDVFWFGVQKFLESPLIGWGVGYGYVWAESANTHNMPLALAVDLGLIGPLFYFTFFGTLIYFTRGAAKLLAVILMLGGLSSHNQFEFLADSLAIAFALASTADYRRISAIGGRGAVPRVAAPPLPSR